MHMVKLLVVMEDGVHALESRDVGYLTFILKDTTHDGAFDEVLVFFHL